LQSIAKKKSAEVPSLVAFVQGKAVEQDGVFNSNKWTTKAVSDFVRPFLPLADQEVQHEKLSGDDAEQHTEL